MRVCGCEKEYNINMRRVNEKGEYKYKYKYVDMRRKESDQESRADM